MERTLRKVSDCTFWRTNNR